MLRARSGQFVRLVEGLKKKGKTCTVVESCCGGLINASIMAVPGSSAVYYGGSVAYNTKRARPLLLNDATLHNALLHPPIASSSSSSSSSLSTSLSTSSSSEAETYIQSKQNWTAKTAVAFCDQMGVDYAIAEGGASGPTFRPTDLDAGFAVVAIAGRDPTTGHATLLAQSTIRSTHADRSLNMRLFADAAATFAADTIGIPPILATATATDDDDHHHNTLPELPSLDRATHLRNDEKALKELEEHPMAKYVVLRNSIECLCSSESSKTLEYLSTVPSGIPKTFLGLQHGGGSGDGSGSGGDDIGSSSSSSSPGTPTPTPIFAIDVGDDLPDGLTLPEGAVFDNTRTHAPLLTPDEYELALYATALSNWKRTHRYCSQCGQPLQVIQGGTCLQCTNTSTTSTTTSSCSSTMSWPRQDPSIIVLVTNRAGDKALLARSPRHPPKMHTALAGFVEAGETFERAVQREVMEETGIHVDLTSITYHSSQPWPFPRSCMIGFLAMADEEAQSITIDAEELVSADWFDRYQVGAAADIPGAVMNPDIAHQALQDDPSLEVLIPPKGVLARSLIDTWLQQQQQQHY